MAETMTASQQPMSDGQIDNAVDKLRAALRKHRSEFDSDVVQEVLGVKNLGMELLAPFRKLVSEMIRIVRVRVDRSRTPEEVLNATGCRQYTDRNVVKTMPRGEGEESEVVFFRLGRYVSDDELEREYDLRGLKAADPYSLAAVNEADPAFANDYPNSTHWKDADGGWCYTAFAQWFGSRNVSVNLRAADWIDDWWHAGLHK